MAPPRPSPTTPRSNTLLNYFTRTPKTPTTEKGQGQEGSGGGSASELKNATPGRSAGPATPTSSRSQPKKRRPTEPHPSPEESNKKRAREDRSPEKDLVLTPQAPQQAENEKSQEMENGEGHETENGEDPKTENGNGQESPNGPASPSELKNVTPGLSVGTGTATPTSSRSQKSKPRRPTEPVQRNGDAPKNRQRDDHSPGKDIVLDRTEQWPHLFLPFLQPGRIQDAKRNPPSHPNYNPRTLYIPDDFLDKQTPGLRQWWDLKAQNYDTVLFFKVGKFYEFYHMDAVIANQELGILYMRGDFAHSGFPEIAYAKWGPQLVAKGYKIARIEQTETPEMMAARCKKIRPTKFDKVVKREICQISTRGVRCASFQDDVYSNPFSSESVFLYGLVEKTSPGGPIEFGVCFVDTTIGIFHIGQFKDDRHCSRLRTLYSHHPPAQILTEKGKLSSSSQQLLNNYTGVRKDSLLPEKEFWGAQKTLKYLAEQSFFRESSSDGLSWPENLKKLLYEGDSLGLTPDEDWKLGIKALGGVVWYLKHCLLDNDLLSMKRFTVYEPIDHSEPISVPTLPHGPKPKYMVLDGITLRNLDITEGAQCLLSFVDRCSTHFGKRLLRQWVCVPLAIPEEISERLDAVEELMSIDEVTDEVVPMLKTLPDLERLLTKVHYLGSSHRRKNHPDGRAFFFEEVKYSKNKISDLLNVLKGFKTCKKIIHSFQKGGHTLKSSLLTEVISNFPSLETLLNHFDNAFDHQAAAKEGKIIPKEGVDKDFDESKQAVIEIDREANDYLREISKQLRTRVTYFGSEKKRFQMEVPDGTRVPKDFEMSSSKKGFKRFYNEETKDFLSSIMKAEVIREEVLRDITRRIFEQFDKHRETWKQAVECIATLDALLSLSTFSSNQEDMCRPVVKYSDCPFVDVVDGRHPCISPSIYIPNSCKLGSSEPESKAGSFVLLTGPNMGGKSTLMRQIGLLTVLSHIGSYVPASKCEMSVVDRIFTRLGANDNIGDGESTFFVEMSETSAILKHSTANSLVLMDELGRGTATYDGTAIAYAVSTSLAEKGCPTVFSTHYHALVDSVEHLPSVQLAHMACMVENENEEDPTQETITFLYKLAPGACPKSYGFNAARLAGIPDEVIRVAHQKAKELEAAVHAVDMFRDICAKTRAKKLHLL